MTKMTYLEARRSAVLDEMRINPKIIMWGEDMRSGMNGLGGTGFINEFGRDRVLDAPVSENAMVGIAAGAAMMGYKPIVDLTCANFATYGFDQLVNQVARIRYLFGGQTKCPIVIRMSMYTTIAGGAHHTDRHYPMLMNVPGLKIICPTTPTSARGLWKAALRDDDPVVIYERSTLSVRREDVPDDPDFVLPLGRSEVISPGDSVTVLSINTLSECMAAVRKLESDGITVELIDALSLVPFDFETLLGSVRKTGRLVIADMANATNGAAAYVSAVVSEQAFGSLLAPIARVCVPDVHIPHARPLEALVFPTPERIEQAIRATAPSDHGIGAPSPLTHER